MANAVKNPKPAKKNIPFAVLSDPKGYIDQCIAKDMKDHVYCLIIAGGEGQRLFPISNPDCPKQMTPYGDEKISFLGATVHRYVSIGVRQDHVVIIVCTDRQKELAIEKLRELKEETGIDVPVGNLYQIDSRYGYAGAMVQGCRYINGIDNKAVVISTPSDQYVEVDDEFARCMKLAIETGAKKPTVIGVKITDTNLMVGCGHASYDRSMAKSGLVPDKVVPIMEFIEKPDLAMATLMLEAGNTAANTGINVFPAAFVAKKFVKFDLEKGELATDVFMEQLGAKMLAIGQFRWEDCGTLKSLRKICKLTPNHHNANISNGSYIERTGCRDSIFYTCAEADLYACNCEEVAVCVERIREKLYIAIVSLADSQKVRELAESYKTSQLVLSSDYSVAGARNNIVVETNSSDEIVVGYCGVIVNNYIVHVIKRRGRYAVSVSRQTRTK